MRKALQPPVVGVGGIILDEHAESVLLIQRGARPSRGLWSVPGGKVDHGETLTAACAREVHEEVGLIVEVDPQPVKILERIGVPYDAGQRAHYVIVDFLCRITGGVVSASSDAEVAQWVAISEVAARQTTKGLEDVLRRAQRIARGEPPLTPLVQAIID